MDTVKINSTSRDAFATALGVAVAAQSPEGVIEQSPERVIEAFASQGAQGLKAMASAAKHSRDRHNGGSSPHDREEGKRFSRDSPASRGTARAAYQIRREGSSRPSRSSSAMWQQQPSPEARDSPA